MAYKTSANKRTRSKPAETGSTTSSTASPQTESTQSNPFESGQNVGPNAARNRNSNGRRNSIFDRMDKDNNGKIDLDDFLIGLRETMQWFASHRFGMICWGGLTAISAGINIAAWGTTLAAMGPISPFIGFFAWGCFQYVELAPILDELNLKSSLAALVRLQRKPMEIPIVNENLHPHAKKAQRKYRDREKNQELRDEIGRWIAYLIEAIILVLGGGIIAAMGVQWGFVLAALLGMVGVEFGLRGFCKAGEKVLSREERDYMNSIIAGHSRQTATASPAQ